MSLSDIFTMKKYNTLYTVLLRAHASKQVKEFAGTDDSSDFYLLYQLLGKDCRHLDLSGLGREIAKFTEEDKYKCELLLSPNGYAIFKMLCIKQGLNELLITQMDK